MTDVNFGMNLVRVALTKVLDCGFVVIMATGLTHSMDVG